MRAPPRPLPQALSRCLRRARVAPIRPVLAVIGALALGFVQAHAQTTPAPAATPTSPLPEEASAGAAIRFQADRVTYASDAETVTATGNVILQRAAQTVRADVVTWNRKSGLIEASGNIRFVDDGGNVLYTDKVELTDQLKAGAIEDLLLVLRQGGRLAARSGERSANGNMVLHNAAFSGCSVEDSDGCTKKPSWEVTAVAVTYDARQQRVHYKGALLRVFGLPLVPLPGLAHTSDFRAESGILIPDFRFSAANGIEINDTYYWRLADNKDLAVTGYLYTAALPMVSARYRQLTDKGAFQVTGYLTRSKRINIGGSATDPKAQEQVFRGYFETNGRFQLGENWSLTGYGRYASDRTFLRRYDISRDDRLRSTIALERIDANSYFSLAGWAVQTLRSGDRQGLVPIALPALEYRRRLVPPAIGGTLELQVNSLALTRPGGQDTQRAFAKAQWDLRTITGLGQEITFTALARGDVYHSLQNDLTTNAFYRGVPGWQGRGIATAAVDIKWPLIGAALGGTQVLTPRVQLVAIPHIRNLAIPNEDSRSVELEDSNLFALNRFPGYDRIEDGVRVTYGADWQLTRPGWRVMTTIGQSYRLSTQKTLLPDGTGLSSRASDIVGRTDLRFRDIVQFTHRFRLDKDSLKLRRNEFDATIGNHRTYAEIGYLRLNRDIPATFEDLRDREELRLSGRVAFARRWSVFGSAVANLTSRVDDPTKTKDGFQMLRHRLGFAYDDDCLDLALTWRRDYITNGDARRGSTVQFNIAFKGLGVR
ncbi:organic solvent tolerance protein [Novosphingobium fuchskuhlense]|uniref:LPS-assembly protein LptD n=1 Tax=Novosphingobium fuchskuhlense TaxID=1117702 RepID=A0A117UY75_9SPHN|nr:LPS assembly protein LptD [Novosphingobium fuchskuhlense]KUR73046.1 organic solvent tolerance protein [Novosphingobium fuchskuhlense]